MDRIFSTRIDEKVIYIIDSLARRLHTSKKKIIEDALRDYAAKAGADESAHVFSETSGAWNRDEGPGELRTNIKRRFADSMTRRRR